MELFHTSPAKITEINGGGRFGSFLFFSGEAYRMGPWSVITYKLEIDEDQIISARRLFWHDDAEKLAGLVEDLATRLDCDADTAEALIEETTSIYDVADDLGIDAEDLADISWDIQHISAKAAGLLGFRGVAVSDEQGASFMINMVGHEAELVEA